MLQIRAIAPGILNINMYALQERHYQPSCSNKKVSIPSSQFQVLTVKLVSELVQVVF